VSAIPTATDTARVLLRVPAWTAGPRAPSGAVPHRATRRDAFRRLPRAFTQIARSRIRPCRRRADDREAHCGILPMCRARYESSSRSLAATVTTGAPRSSPEHYAMPAWRSSTRPPPDTRQIVETAIQDDADAVGVSILSGLHMTLVPRIVDGSRANGAAASSAERCLRTTRTS
jgi:hypothetical protein